MPINEILYRITRKTFCAGVIVVNEKITETAPILKKFKGQPISNLYNWAIKNNMKFERL